MVKAKFVLRGEDAQQQGIRLILTSKLVKNHFEKASVWGDPNGYETEVLLEGDEDKIQCFYELVKENIIDWINERNRDLDIAVQYSRNPGLDVGFSDLEFNKKYKVHRLDLFSHSLTIDEVSKGYNIFLDNIITNKALREAITSTNKELREELTRLGNINKELLEQFRKTKAK